MDYNKKNIQLGTRCLIDSTKTEGLLLGEKKTAPPPLHLL
jgi:hypothetical protein